MTTTFDRREFLAASSVACAGALLGSTALADQKSEKRLFRISLAQWSLNRRFFGREQPKLDNLEFAKTARDFGIDAIEYVNQFFFQKAKDETYLADMKKRAADHGVKSLLIMVDSEGNLGEADKNKRRFAVEKHFKWADAAKFLGCHSVRVNARSDAKLSFEEQMDLAADGLRQLTEYGAKLDLNVIVENHGGLSSNGKWLAGVMKKVDHKRCGTLPDFGNFRVSGDQWYDRYQGVKELMPYAKAVSAKAHGFDKSRPWVTVSGQHETDYLKMMRIVLDAGYRGWVGIESEGGQNQFEGVQNTKALLERVHEKLSSEYKS
ncbi:MAG: sugar phosphate isomerase/epimerase [Planctomycetota bacterium]|nr:sugar phosphate isomerase/epimerase [Planctomycetota bacterium]